MLKTYSFKLTNLNTTNTGTFLTAQLYRYFSDPTERK